MIYICKSLNQQLNNMSEENQNEKAPKSPKEVAEMRKNMEDQYRNQMSLLKVQKEYENLLADIEEARYRRVLSTMRISQMLAPEQPDQEEPKEQPTA